MDKFDGIIVPDFSGGLRLDWTKVFPADSMTLEYFITPRVCIVIRDILDSSTRNVFSIGHLFESHKEFDCKNFGVRVRNESPYKFARAKRVFQRRRKSLFFDEEEVDILARLFKQEVFTAVIEFKKDGEEKILAEFSDRELEYITRILDDWNAIHPMGIHEYDKYRKHKKAIMKKGGNEMFKAAVWVGVAVLGAFLTTGASIKAVIAVKEAIGDIIPVELITGGS